MCLIKFNDLSQKSSISDMSVFACRQELEHPLIFIHDKKVSDINSLVRILELALGVKKSFLLCGSVTHWIKLPFF